MSTLEQAIAIAAEAHAGQTDKAGAHRLRDERFADAIIVALQSVTKCDGEDYEDFVRRATINPIGRSVKLADLRDNCDLARIAAPSERDFHRIEKYRRST